MRKTNKEEGITLITLIITIVLMLILIGVTLDITQGSVFNEVDEGVNKANLAIEQQQNAMDSFVNEWEKSLFSDESDEETEIIIGAYINGYNPSKAEDGSTINTSYTSQGAQSGGTLEIDGTTDGSKGNGYGNQTFTVKSIDKWRIVGEENGQIIITTADPIAPDGSGSTYYIRGQAGYVNMTSELDKICSIYGQGKYADKTKYEVGDGTTKGSGGRSINLEDTLYELKPNTIVRTYTKKANGGGTLKIYTDNVESSFAVFTYYDEESKKWKSLNEGESVTLTYRGIIAKEGTALQEEMVYMQSDNVTKASYWINSKFVQLNDGYTHFFGRSIAAGGTSQFGLFYSDGWPKVVCYGVRPVVYLKSGVKLRYNESTNEFTILGCTN